MRSRLPQRPGPARSDARLSRLDALARFLDNSIRLPGIGYRIGYDALIGLIPGIGDVIGLGLSTYIVLEAARFRLPFSTLLRMVVNVGIEAIVGVIPLVGDVFDATWKANARNMALLHERLERPDPHAAARDRRFIVGVVAAIILLLLGVCVGVFYLVRALLSLLGL